MSVIATHSQKMCIGDSIEFSSQQSLHSSIADISFFKVFSPPAMAGEKLNAFAKISLDIFINFAARKGSGIREAAPKKKRTNFGTFPKGGGGQSKRSTFCHR